MKRFLTIITTLVITLATFATVSHASNLQPLDKMNYNQSSETVPYPDLKNYHNLNVLVKIHQNKVYIKNDNQTIYTMYCSAGKIDPKTGKSYTPTGRFAIQKEKGNSFYNKQLKEGANNWISFKDHGVYLFHSVPTDQYGHYKSVASSKLGHQPDSHGCIRLSVPDSAWFSHNIPVNTPVTIED